MKFFQKLENLFSAAAFAEEGEFETARQIAGEDARSGKKPAVAKGVNPRAGRRGRTAPYSPKA